MSCQYKRRYLRVFCGDEGAMTNRSDKLGRLIRANYATAGIKQPSHSWRGVKDRPTDASEVCALWLRARINGAERDA